MTFDGNEHAIRIFGIDEGCGGLVGRAEAEVLRGPSGISRFVDAVAGAEVRALQPFAAAYVDDVGIGRRNGDGADRARVLIVEDRLPGVARVRGLPYAAVDRGHVENIGLVRHASEGHGAPAPKQANAPPPHFGKQHLTIFLAAQPTPTTTPS